MPISSLWVAGVRFGQEWTHCFENIAHFAKRAGTIRVQEDRRYIYQMGVCIQTMHLTPHVVLQQPFGT